MTAPLNGETLEFGAGGVPLVQTQGLNTNQPANFGSTFNAVGAVTMESTLAVTGVTTFAVPPVYTTGQTMPAPVLSALVGATVVLTASQSGGVFINRSTSGSPSWTLPTAAAGLYYIFLVSNTTAGFTVTGGTIFAKANPAGASVTGTTLTNTQGTAVIGDSITLYCDGTSWRGIAQLGTFAAS